MSPRVYLKSVARIAAQRWLPVKWSFKASALASRIKVRLQPEWRERRAARMRPFLPAGASERDLEETVCLSWTALKFALRSYAPVYHKSRGWLLKALEPEGLQHLEEVRRGGRGAIILGTHAGLYSWVAPILRQLGYPVRPTQRKSVTSDMFLLMKWDGALSALLPYPAGEEGVLHFKRLHDLIRAGVWIQQTGDYGDLEKGLTGRFMGHDIRCRRGPWSLGRATGAPILPVLVLLNRDFSFKLLVSPPIYVDGEAPAENGTRRAFQTYLDFLEQHLSRRPWNLSRTIWEKLMAGEEPE
jgi:lauroyl/myristoyl acyltransferase